MHWLTKQFKGVWNVILMLKKMEKYVQIIKKISNNSNNIGQKLVKVVYHKSLSIQLYNV